MTEYPRFPSSLTTKVLRMRENSRQLEVRAKRRPQRRRRLPDARGGGGGAAATRGHDALAPRLLYDDVLGCVRLIAKAACFLYDLRAVTSHTNND